MARIVDACEQLEGAYSLVFLTEDKIVAVRDIYGFRPLVMGRKRNGAYVFASETCALDLIEAEYSREVRYRWQNPKIECSRMADVFLVNVSFCHKIPSKKSGSDV